jgi:hypothetical protein
LAEGLLLGGIILAEGFHDWERLAVNKEYSFEILILIKESKYLLIGITVILSQAKFRRN